MAGLCPQLKSIGSCPQIPTCPYRHNATVCVPCGVVCGGPNNYIAHIRGKAHRARTNGGKTIFRCPLCDKKFPELSWDAHLSSLPHIAKASARGISENVTPQVDFLTQDERHCLVCDRIVNIRGWSEHIISKYHKKMDGVVTFRGAFEDAEKDKDDLKVSHDEEGLNFDIVEVDDAKRGVRTHIWLQNTNPSTKIDLVELKLLSLISKTPSNFKATVQSPSRTLVHGKDYHIAIEFRQQHIGRYEDRLEMIFENTLSRRRFAIVRPLLATVGSKTDHEELEPKAPFVSKKRRSRPAATTIVPGPPAAATNVIKWTKQLPFADIPKDVSDFSLSETPAHKLAETAKRTILPMHYNSKTYGRSFQVLLWMEEHQMLRDLETYDLYDAQLQQHNDYFWLDVPGLAENRPSVLVGDQVLVQRNGSDKGHWFEGHVHVVRLLSVGLKFHPSFRSHTAGSRYNVRFKLNRIPLRRQHQALLSPFIADRILFPVKRDIRGHVPTTAEIRKIRLHIYNDLISNNVPQLQAVTAIAQLPLGSPPFVVFGPPGTGKTVTIVEAIRQLLRLFPAARIIACAPSNSAADLIASRLSMLGPDQLFRLYVPSRRKEKVPDDLLPFTYRNVAENVFSVPPLDRLRRYKVVVATCVAASILYGVGISPGHFTHVFIDEAGQATEPEAMVSIKNLANNNTNVTLSGDPKQLGPIIRSRVAMELGFGESYLERIMGRDAYKEHWGSGKGLVKLVKNFRSHEDILTFPNKAFYGDQLEPCGAKAVTHSYINWPLLVNKQFPIIFHAVSGGDQREASSPSFFNIPEITLVKHYIEALRSDRRFRTTDHDIGVITPYQGQCGRLRSALKGFANEVKVGTVEEFQGQERKVIIISTVRSSKEFVEYDLRHTLGFVSSPRRFNVAVTRAKALLIIIGDPDVLSLDPLWRSFLNYVHSNNGWRGNPPSWNTKESVGADKKYDEDIVNAALLDMHKFRSRMSSLTLADLLPNFGDEEDDGEVERPAQREME